MSEYEAPDEKFDPARATGLRAQALGTFKRQMVKVERYMMVFLLVSVLMMAGGALVFVHNQSLKVVLAATLLILIGYETSVLIKLWYWIINNKVGVLKEIKLLRIDLAAAGFNPAEAAIPSAENSPWMGRGMALPRWERILWTLAIVAVAGFSGAIVGANVAREAVSVGGEGSMLSERTVAIDAAGQAKMETVYFFENTSSRPLNTFTVYHGGELKEKRTIPAAQSTVEDGKGRKLEIEQIPAGQNYQNVVHFAEPVAPGERYTLKWTETDHAVRKGGDWTFTMAQNWGYKSNHYVDTLTLPPGALVLNVTPEPARQETRDGAPVLTLMNTLGTGGRWEYTITYHLP